MLRRNQTYCCASTKACKTTISYTIDNASGVLDPQHERMMMVTERRHKHGISARALSAFASWTISATASGGIPGTVASTRANRVVNSAATLEPLCDETCCSGTSSSGSWR